MPRLSGIATAIAVLLVAAPLAAQRVASPIAVQSAAPSTATVQPPVAAPGVATVEATPVLVTQANAAVGVRAVAGGSAPAALPAPFRAESSRNMAMMIVGGAGLLVGAVVGHESGTIIMVAGAVIGLLGLWGYLK